jgi:pyridoxamine 5'-phosphate oxidase
MQPTSLGLKARNRTPRRVATLLPLFPDIGMASSMSAAAAAAEWTALVQRSIDLGGGALPTRFVQLATLTGAGHPAVRTVVFRGWHRTSADASVPALKFVTDMRSAKIEALEVAPWAEVCWYFGDSREQFRFTGTLSVVGPNTSPAELRSAREEQWLELSDAARLQFRYPAPGLPRDVRRGGEVDGCDPFLPVPPRRDVPEDTYALLLLQPTAVDHYCSATAERQRWYADMLSSGDKTVRTWTRTFVNP